MGFNLYPMTLMQHWEYTTLVAICQEDKKAFDKVRRIGYIGGHETEEIQETGASRRAGYSNIALADPRGSGDRGTYGLRMGPQDFKRNLPRIAP